MVKDVVAGKDLVRAGEDLVRADELWGAQIIALQNWM